MIDLIYSANTISHIQDLDEVFESISEEEQQFFSQGGVESRRFRAEEPVVLNHVAEEMRRVLHGAQRILETLCRAGEGAVLDRQDLAGADHALLSHP